MKFLFALLFIFSHPISSFPTGPGGSVCNAGNEYYDVVNAHGGMGKQSKTSLYTLTIDSPDGIYISGEEYSIRIIGPPHIGHLVKASDGTFSSNDTATHGSCKGVLSAATHRTNDEISQKVLTWTAPPCDTVSFRGIFVHKAGNGTKTLHRTAELIIDINIPETIVSGVKFYFAWFSIIFVGLGTTITNYVLFSRGLQKKKPFNHNYWGLLAVQSFTGYAVLFVPIKELYGPSLCSLQYVMSRVSTVLHLAPVVVLSMWLWFKLTTELEKSAVSRGDPRIVRKFLRKKKLTGGCTLFFEISLLCFPPFVAIIIDSARNIDNLKELTHQQLVVQLCNEDFLKISSYILSPFYTLSSLVAWFISWYTKYKYHQGRRVVWHIWRNLALVIILVMAKLIIEKIPSIADKLTWDASYIMVFLPFPIWSIMFIYVPIWKQARKKVYYNGQSTYTLNESLMSGAEAKSASNFESLMSKKAEKNPARISKRMFARLLLTDDGGEAFLKHMQNMFCGEIFLFFKDAEAFKTTPTVKKMKLIMKTYIGDDAPLEVNLPAIMIENLDRLMQENPPEPTMFQEAQEECLKLMKTNMNNKFRFSASAWGDATRSRREQREVQKKSEMSPVQIAHLIQKMSGKKGILSKNSSFTGADCVKWLMKNDMAWDEEHAIQRAQEMIKKGVIVYIPSEENSQSPTPIVSGNNVIFENLESTHYRWGEGNTLNALSVAGMRGPKTKEKSISLSSQESSISKGDDEIELTNLNTTGTSSGLQ